MDFLLKVRSVLVFQAGLWSAVEYPAYREPLALLDCTTVDFDADVIEFIDVSSDLGFSASDKKPAAERVPAATQVKIMNFPLEMMNFVLKMMDFVFKRMNLHTGCPGAGAAVLPAPRVGLLPRHGAGRVRALQAV